MDKVLRKHYFFRKNEMSTIISEIVDNTKKIYDFYLYDTNDSLSEEKVSLTKISNSFKYKFEYEIWHNEINLPKNKFVPQHLIELVTLLQTKLNEKFNENFIIYVSINDYFDVRFTKKRENESLWLVDDLNKYESPVLICI